MSTTEQELAVLQCLMRLPEAYWQTDLERVEKLPLALRRRLDQADRSFLQTLLVEVLFRLHGRGSADKGN